MSSEMSGAYGRGRRWRSWKHLMIKIVASVGLASVVAFSAWAQSYDPSIGSGNLNMTGQADLSFSPPIRRVGRLRCDLDMDCRREELVGPLRPRPWKKR
jgi:hypothetical protein